MSVADKQEKSCVSSADARSQLRSVLTEVCCGLLRPEVRRLRDDALLVVSELIANALKHAGGVTGFSIHVNSDELQLRVSDASRTEPRPLPVLEGLPGGYGWNMVHRLCSRLHVTMDPVGKTVTAALALPRESALVTAG
ncbi:ATP-binding protein [Streptomyces sp. NPDC046716]|uniref:ATP-binding protein n=1 Tax=Streptomyces sp. NPDC046716 TaxID=3157093 RepID=UPI0033F15325